MSDTKTSSPEQATSTLEGQATQRRTGILREFADFLGHNKKWWLLPIVIVLLLVGVLLVAGATGAAPFIYTLF